MAAKRIYGLDILRAAAIIYVMLSHGADMARPLIDPASYNWLTLDGVGLFFVLSGFLIGGILIRTIMKDGVTFRDLFRFWLRRWFRTLPNYYLVLTVLMVCYYLAHQCLPPHWISYITFTQCFAGPHPLFFGEAWSLAVEEWFYILIPMGLFGLVYLAKKNSPGYMLLWIVIVLLVGTLIRVIKLAQHDYFATNDFDVEIGRQVITRMDGIMYGMLGAWLSIYKPIRWRRHKKAGFVVGLLLLFVSKILFAHSLFFFGYWYYSLAAIGTLCLLPLLSGLSSGKGPVFKILTFISTISYAMYLTNHMIVQRALLPRLLKFIHAGPPESMGVSIISLALFWVLTVCLSYALYRLWEQPFLKARDRWPGISDLMNKVPKNK